VKLTVIVSGMISAVPCQGGATWAVLQYLLGFRRLGHDVYFVESVAPDALQPHGASLADSRNARYFGSVMTEFGFVNSSALIAAGSRECVGLNYDELRCVARRTDVLINISGLLVDETLLERIPVRLYLDLDPAFTQLWHFAQGIDLRLVAAARGLGATRWQAFRRVFLPLSLPGLVGAGVLVFIFSLGFYVTPAILGGGRVFMIAEYIAVQILNVIRWGLGAMLATTLLASVLLLMGALGRLVNVRKLFGAA